jgi:L-seryl-tRNA(Ser) seleniumtransferase
MIAAPLEEMERRAKVWAEALGEKAKVAAGETMVGGGSLPGGSLPTRLVVMGGGSKYIQAVSRKLRLRDIPVVGRIEKDKLLLDPRTVLPEEDGLIIRALREIRE